MEQLTFDDSLFEEDSTRRMGPKALRRAALAWLLEQDPVALALRVPTSYRRYLADAAAFWDLDADGTQRTVVIETRRSREACWPDHVRSEAILPELRRHKRERGVREQSIREDESHLRESATLFEEYADWNYAGSSDAEYHSILADIAKAEKAIYRGTRFELLCRAEMASELYLAVPERTVHPHELAADWGLIWVAEDLSTTLISKAQPKVCPIANSGQLIRGIATAASAAVCFAAGVEKNGGGVRFLRPPKRRRS
ncbi:MAG: hypothetical protein ACI8W8_002536 [Rhodothermales bacterium]|jgi:hypothetical protein